MMVLLFYINYLIYRYLTIKGPFGYSHQKRKKPSLSSFRPGVGLCERSPIGIPTEESAKSLNVSRSFYGYNGFSFRSFTDFCHAHPNARPARNDVSRYGHWADYTELSSYGLLTHKPQMGHAVPGCLPSLCHLNSNINPTFCTAIWLLKTHYSRLWTSI